MKLSDLGEFGFIDRISSGCLTRPEHVVKGIGDDCSVTRGSNGSLHLVTTDLLVEGVHFLRDRISPRQLGSKAMTVNLSDIAAMGGRPVDAFVSIAIPYDITIEYLESVYAGLKSTAEPYGVNILGGDTSGSKGDLVLNVVLTGVVTEPDVLFRHGARPGDHIYVTGTLGDSAGGLDAIVQHRGDSSEVARLLVQRHLEPRAQVVEGQRIAATRTAHAMLDISDGLAADLGHICAQSGVGCVVEARKLPISIALCEYCAAHGLDPVALALAGGEDYVLLFCAPVDFAAAGVSAIDIGTIVAEAGCQLVGLQGEIRALDTWGWDHLRHTPTPSLS